MAAACRTCPQAAVSAPDTRRQRQIHPLTCPFDGVIIKFAASPPGFIPIDKKEAVFRILLETLQGLYGMPLEKRRF